MAHDHARDRPAEGVDRVHELARAQDEHLRPQDARVGDPAREADHDDQCREARPQHRDDADREQDEGERELRVGERHDHAVGEPAPVARRDPERRAERAAHAHRREADDQRDARPVDHPREDVAAEMVGAEEPRAPVRGLPRGRGQAIAERLARRVVGREPRRGDRDRAQRQHERESRHGQARGAPGARACWTGCREPGKFWGRPERGAPGCGHQGRVRGSRTP